MADEDTAPSPKRLKLDTEAEHGNSGPPSDKQAEPGVLECSKDTEAETGNSECPGDKSALEVPGDNQAMPEVSVSKNSNDKTLGKEVQLAVHSEKQCKPSVSSSGSTDTTVTLSTNGAKTSKSESDGAADSGPQTTHCKETDVGIIEYISKHEGFTGILKQRYSDFLVHEIRLDGTEVHLTSCDLPEPDEQPPNPQTLQVDPALSDVLDAGTIGKLQELAASKDRTKSELIKVGDDKAIRGRIHATITGMFPGLDSNTVSRDDGKFIQVKLSNNQGNGLRRWPKGRGDYCRFVLYKENKDTMDTISLIAKILKVKSSLFQYAGTKDKRAKTAQEITVYRLSADKLLDNNKKLRGNIVTGNYSYVKEPMKLGQLLGNRFTIVLRSVSGNETQIKEAMNSLKEQGFINYYGMQRFGTSSIPTHHIGRALLQSNWKEAVQLILKPRDGDDPAVNKARQVWWKTGNCNQALRSLPHRCYIERTILEGLAKKKEDYLGSMSKMSRNARLMYVHSYQSYVWNTMVSHRLREYGMSPVVGDLVLPRGSTTTDVPHSETVSDSEGTKKATPKLVTEENIGDYSIVDVVLPLPGYDVIYPENQLKDQYRGLMARDSLDVDNMRHKTKDFSLSGAYRHIVVQPKDVTWRICAYNNVESSLVLSDLDRLNGEPVTQTVTDGSRQALVVEMTLPASCYATMAVREILKTDTSASHMTSLNVT